MSDSARLRLGLVGPTHPYKGGVAAHTTTLAHELTAAGHEVTLIGWSHLFPSALYPGEGPVPSGVADVEPFPRTARVLSWSRPDTWVRAGRRLRGLDAIIIVHVIPPAVPCHLAILRAAGSGRTSSTGSGPRSVVIAHDVLPHAEHSGDTALVRSMFRRVDTVLVHSPGEAKVAHDLDADHVVVAGLPPHLPGGSPVRRPEHDGPPRLLALGRVREDKGLDVLLRALTRVPELELTVAGEMWGESGRLVKDLADHPALRGRVHVHGGYVPADRIAPLLARHDVLVLPYLSATASQNALLGQEHGLAVLASDVGAFGAQVRDGIDGLLVPPGDEDAIVEALSRLAVPGYAARLRSAVRRPDSSGPWADYVGALEALATEAPAVPEDLPSPRVETSGWAARAARLVGSARALVPGRRPRRVELTGSDLPDWVRPTDVLATDDDAAEARTTAREVGLPGSPDGQAAWAALGALAAVLRVRDDGQRSSLIVDESGSRSPFSQWARAIGFAPVELELGGRRSSIDVLEVETASLDVITRLHPCGCDAEDVDETVNQASWALRTGGLLCITLPVGPPGAEGSLGPADLRGVLARAGDLGFVLVGDLDGDLTRRLRDAEDSASRAAGRADTAYALIRLTLRRR